MAKSNQGKDVSFTYFSIVDVRKNYARRVDAGRRFSRICFEKIMYGVNSFVANSPKINLTKRVSFKLYLSFVS